MNSRKLPFKKALTAIVAATIGITGGAVLSVLYYSHIFESQKNDPAFYLKYLDQKGDLPSHYIEEVLGLCVDRKVNIHDFSVSKARKKLEESPLIAAAEVKKQMPDSCQVIYRLFEPVAVVTDWENAAVDQNGRLIPFLPFYDKMGLPQITVGEVDHPAWGKKLRLARVHTALKILRKIPLQDLVRLDVSRVDLPSFGQREIIVTLQDAILRLNPDQWEDGWNNFLNMRSVLSHQPLQVVDLRIPKIAIIRD